MVLASSSAGVLFSAQRPQKLAKVAIKGPHAASRTSFPFHSLNCVTHEDFCRDFLRCSCGAFPSGLVCSYRGDRATSDRRSLIGQPARRASSCCRPIFAACSRAPTGFSAHPATACSGSIPSNSTRACSSRGNPARCSRRKPARTGARTRRFTARARSLAESSLPNFRAD